MDGIGSAGISGPSRASRGGFRHLGLIGNEAVKESELLTHAIF